MKVFIAGATGAIGKRLIPLCLRGGHEVVAMTRSPGKSDELRRQGAEVAIADALDRGSVMQAVLRAEPEIVLHELTALTGVTSLKNFDREFALTNRLRTDGLDNLLEAARAAGARRLIAQSYGNWNYARTGSRVMTEEDPLDPSPLADQVQSMAAIRHLESRLAEADDIEGIALRYAGFYGPGTSLSSDGEVTELIRKRRFPIVGSGEGVWSFVHIDDAAAATVAAIDRGAPGVYNVADDEPAPVAEWLPELAAILGAKPPRRVPVWVGRLFAGEVGVSFMTEIRGASNAKAKRELGWAPRYASWREGFRTGLGGVSSSQLAAGPSPR